MPADIPKLIRCLSSMKETYLNDPTGAVRGSTFIQQLHDYCMDELYDAIGSSKIQQFPLVDMKKPA